MRAALPIAFLAAWVGGATSLRAEQLGERHSVVLSAVLSRSDGLFSPAIDFFIAPRLSLGVRLGVYETFDDIGHFGSLFVEGRVGYAVRLAERVTLWPHAGVELHRIENQIHDPIAGDSNPWAYQILLDLSAPLVVEPVPRFFLGIGPHLTKTLATDESLPVGFPSRTGVTLQATVGGWL